MNSKTLLCPMLIPFRLWKCFLFRRNFVLNALHTFRPIKILCVYHWEWKTNWSNCIRNIFFSRTNHFICTLKQDENFIALVCSAYKICWCIQGLDNIATSMLYFTTFLNCNSIFSTGFDWYSKKQKKAAVLHAFICKYFSHIFVLKHEWFYKLRYLFVNDNL